MGLREENLVEVVGFLLVLLVLPDPVKRAVDLPKSVEFAHFSESLSLNLNYKMHTTEAILSKRFP